MIKCRVLNNGVKCYVVEKKGFAEKEAMILFDYGSCDTVFKADDKNVRQPSGIAHFLEHKMFEEKDRNIFDEFTKYGGVSNAYTNASSTAYYFTCTDNFKENFSILLSMVGDLYITDESIEKEKGIIGQEINMYEDDPYWQIYFNTLKCCYKNNSIRESVPGSVESISEINRDMLYTSYNSFYTYDNCQVVVVGDVDFERVCQQVEKELSLNNNSNIDKKRVYENGIYTKRKSVKMSVDKAIYNFGFKENNIIDDLAMRISLNNIVLNLITGRSSRLWYKLYAKGLIDDSFGYDYVCGADYGCAIIKGEGNHYEEILAYINEEIDNVISYGVNEDIIARLSKSIKGKMLMDFDNIPAITSFIADCSSKKIEVLDIYENYGKINSNDIIYALKNNYSDFAVSIIEPE